MYEDVSEGYDTRQMRHFGCEPRIDLRELAQRLPDDLELALDR